jgi:hypothetical protein
VFIATIAKRKSEHASAPRRAAPRRAAPRRAAPRLF